MKIAVVGKKWNWQISYHFISNGTQLKDSLCALNAAGPRCRAPQSEDGLRVTVKSWFVLVYLRSVPKDYNVAYKFFDDTAVCQNPARKAFVTVNNRQIGMCEDPQSSGARVKHE